jgi:Tfp pilus assembly protein PilX
MSNNRNNKTEKERGVSLLLAILILSLVLGIALGLSLLLTQQLKMVKGIDNSVGAFFAADSGIEDALLQMKKGTCCNKDTKIHGNCGEDGEYDVRFLPKGEGGCPRDKDWGCLQSKGKYRGVSRAIELSY